MNFKTFLNESSIWENFIFATRQLSRMHAGRRISSYIAQKQKFYVISVINDRFLSMHRHFDRLSGKLQNKRQITQPSWQTQLAEYGL